MPDSRYFYRNRPPGIGCQPDGWEEREAWSPVRAVPEIASDLKHHHFHGWVEYQRALTPYICWKYELLPADPVERAVFMFYVSAGRDTPEMIRMIDDHMDCLSANEGGRDVLVWYASILRDAGLTGDEVGARLVDSPDA